MTATYNLLMKQVYIIAGPNGSGKTVLAKELVKELKLPFINADEIALSMAANGNVRKVRLRAGKLFLKELQKHIDKNGSFVVETTLAGKYFVRIIKQLRKRKYKIVLIYIFVESRREAINKIRLRVKKGGHHVPDEDVIRRFGRSKNNFWNIYKNLIDDWRIYFSVEETFVPVAIGSRKTYNVIEEKGFELFLKGLDNI